MVKARTLRTHVAHFSGEYVFVDPRLSTTNLIPLLVLSATRAYVHLLSERKTEDIYVLGLIKLSSVEYSNQKR